MTAVSKAYELLKTRSFLRGVLLLIGGTGGGAALVVLAAPLLSRYYLPSAFGMLAVYVSMLSMLTAFSSLRYEMAIPLPEDDRIAANLLAASLILVVTVGSLVACCLALFSESIAGWAEAPALAPYLLLLPAAVIGAGSYQALGFWALRKEQFAIMARTRFSQGLGTVVPQIGCALWQATPLGLIAGETLGRFSGLALLIQFAWNDVPWSSITMREMHTAARRYIKFPVLNAPASLLTAAGSQIPVLILAHSFGPAVAGFFGLTSKILQAPASLIGQAVAQTFFARAATVSSDRVKLRKLTETTATVLFAVSLPIFGVVVLNGPSLFALVFGDKWMRSGEYAQWLAPFYLIWLIANPLSNLLAVREWQGTVLFYSALECAVKAAALTAGVRLGSDRIAVEMFAIASGALGLITINRFFQAAYSNWRRLLPPVSVTVLVAVVSLGVTAVLVSGTQIQTVLFRILISCLLYAVLAWKSRRWMTA